jgi:hypothetical protein
VLVHFDDFGPNVPRKARYVRGIDFLQHEFDLDVADTLYLIDHLKHDRSSVYVFAENAMVDFYLFDEQLNVQIDGIASGFWHASNIDLTAAKGILDAAQRGDDFGSQIPGTDRTWDVY